MAGTLPGSNTRQRIRVLPVRLKDEEQAALSARAAEAGLSLGAYARGAMLGMAGPRVCRQPAAPRDELRRLEGEFGRVGDNVNQVAWTLNANQPHEEGEVAAAMDELREVGRATRAALEEQGLTPARGQRRGLVLVDEAGDVHSLTRQIRDARAKEIKERLSDIDAASLPDAEQARERQQRARAGRDAEERQAAVGQGTAEPDRPADRVSEDRERPGSAERAADSANEIDRVAAGQARDWRELRGAQRAERHHLGVRQREEAAEAAQAARDWLARERAMIPRRRARTRCGCA